VKAFHIPSELAGEARSKVENAPAVPARRSHYWPNQPAPFSPAQRGERPGSGLSGHRFEAYLDKVFDWSRQVKALPEGRQSPQHE
jgi:hypothetical protein